jgi:PEP-CTERM motif
MASQRNRAAILVAVPGPATRAAALPNLLVNQGFETGGFSGSAIGGKRPQFGVACFIRTMAAIFGFCFFVTVPLARAVTIWSWSFDQTEYVVGPADTILLRATLFNDASSTGSIISFAGGSFTGDLQNTYTFTFATSLPQYSQQFFLMDVPPGGSFPFVLGLLTPIGGAAPIGYQAVCCDQVTNEAHLFFEPSDGPPTSEPPSNGFSLLVVEGAQEVPEPATLFLLGTGLLGVAARRRRSM